LGTGTVWGTAQHNGTGVFLKPFKHLGGEPPDTFGVHHPFPLFHLGEKKTNFFLSQFPGPKTQGQGKATPNLKNLFLTKTSFSFKGKAKGFSRPKAKIQGHWGVSRRGKGHNFQGNFWGQFPPPNEPPSFTHLICGHYLGTPFLRNFGTGCGPKTLNSP